MVLRMVVGMGLFYVCLVGAEWLWVLLRSFILPLIRITSMARRLELMVVRRVTRVVNVVVLVLWVVL